MYDPSDTACVMADKQNTQPALMEPSIRRILLSAPQYRKGQQWGRPHTA